MRKSIRNLALAALVALGMGYSNDVNAGDNSIEVSVGNEAVTLDTKAFGEVGPLNIYNRNIVSVDYDNSPSALSITDLSMPTPADGLDVVVEGQVGTNLGLVPRLGLQYFNSIGSFSAFALATTGYNIMFGEVDGEVLLELNLSPEINETTSLYFNAENLVNFSKRLNLFNVDAEAGVTVNDVTYGLGVNLDLVNNHTNYDAFVSVNF